MPRPARNQTSAAKGKAARPGSRTTRAAGTQPPATGQPPRSPLAMIRNQAERMAYRIAGVKYDSAQTGGVNRLHWTMADGASPIASLTPEIRRRLVQRCRYEAHNSSFVKGIGSTIAQDLVGTGPRLRMMTPDAKGNQAVEDLWERWAKAVRLSGKLRTMRFARFSDGECFGVKSTNRALQHPIKLDLRLYETEQFDTPDLYGNETPRKIAGIEYDDAGNPVTYNLLKTHPGEMGSFTSPHDYQPIKAANVIHYFRAERPGQLRGVPDIVPALSLFALMRRFTLATVAAAEMQANRSGYLHTTGSATNDTSDTSEAGATDPAGLYPFETVEFGPNEMTALPEGWQATFANATQPTTTFADFQFASMREACRCINVPVAVAIGDSSKSNYSSGRLDHQVYVKQIAIEQRDMADTVLEPLFADFWAEAQRVSDLWGDGPGQIPLKMRNTRPTHKWMWDGREHVDPSKEAKAATERMANRTSSLAEECAIKGTDWKEVLAQQAAESAYARSIGAPDPHARPDVQPSPSTASAPSEQELEEAAQ